MKEIQEKVREFVRKHDLDTSSEVRMLDLASEVGELAKELLKTTDYGKSEDKGKLSADELGDVLFSLVCLANTQKIDLSEALEKALFKYEERIKHKNDPSSGKS